MPGILSPNNDWDLDTRPGATTDSGSGGSGDYSDAVIPETGTLQILLSEGPIEGLVDGLKSVFLDGTPIQNSDGSFNFKGIAMTLVAGTNTQPAIKGITGTESETSVNVQVVKATPVIRSVSSGCSAVRVRVAIPALKIVSTTDGNASGHAVTIKIERKHATYTSGAWQEVPLQGGGVITGGPFSTKYTKAYRIDTPASGTWDIRLTRVSDDDADAYHLSQTWWDAYTEIVDARLRYPYSSVLSLRVNAKQFRAIPKVTVRAKLRKIQVPTNYDPIARTYATSGAGTTGGVWDGTFKTAWSNNPAWVFYDAASHTRYGAGSFLTASRLNKYSLYSIAEWCDASENDGKGGTEPRMTCNIYLQSQENAIRALANLASVFWGVLYYANGQVHPVADTDTSPVALFSNANVENGRFTYEGTALQARHTAAVVSFQNPDLAYATDAAVYQSSADAALITALGWDPEVRYGYRPLDLKAIGCTSAGQALRMARMAVLSELLAPETVGFKTGLDGAVIAPGEVIQIADQHRAGNARFGGRIRGTATTTSVQLDGPVTLGAGTYYLKVLTSAGVESRTITNPAGTHQVITVSSAFSEAPSGSWQIQEGTAAALYRILAVRKGEGLIHEVVALKHDPAKYAMLGLSTGDVVAGTPATPSTPAPSGLTLGTVTRILNDRQQVMLTADWTLDAALGYKAEASRDYGPWLPMTVLGPSALLDGAQPGAWRVRVAGEWRGLGWSTWATASTSLTASTAKPLWVDAVAKGDIQSPNYTAGTSSAAPVGFRWSQNAFTTTFIGGATDAKCQAEMGGTANFGGYKVATVNNRLFTAYNRILNGVFYSSLGSWDVSSVTWNSASSTSAAGSAAVASAGATITGSISQPFNCPKSEGTINLTLATAITTTSGGTGSGSVVAKLFNATTGAETTLATWSYANGTNPTTPSWTARTVDVTSLIGGGGAFVLKIEISATNTTSLQTTTTYVDDIKILI